MMGAHSVMDPGGEARPCGACGYDLRGNVSGRCPECGARARRGVGGIPWEHRAHRGTAAAWVATLRMVLGRPTEFARQAQGAVRRAPARQFHRISLATASAAMIGVIALLMAVGDGLPVLPRWGWAMVREIGVAAAAVAMVPVGLAASMAVWRVLAVGHPRRLRELRRRKHAALYASALMPVVAVLALLAGGAWGAAGTGGATWEWQTLMGIAGTGFAAAAYLCLVVPLIAVASEWNAGPVRWAAILVLYPVGLVWVWMALLVVVATLLGG